MNDSQQVSGDSSEIHQMADSVVSSVNFQLAAARSQSLLNAKFNVRRHLRKVVDVTDRACEKVCGMQ